MHLGGLGEDAVEIEEAGADPTRQPESLRIAGHAQTVQKTKRSPLGSPPRRRLRCRLRGRPIHSGGR